MLTLFAMLNSRHLTDKRKNLTLTFSPVKETTSSGPYMKRPARVCGRPSNTITSLARWFGATFCIQPQTANVIKCY